MCPTSVEIRCLLSGLIKLLIFVCMVEKKKCSDLSTNMLNQCFEFNQHQPQLVGQAGKKTPTRILITLQPKQAGLGVSLISLWRMGRNGKYCPESERRKLNGNVLMKEL